MPEELQPSLERPIEASRPMLPVPGFWSRALALGIDVALLTLVFYYLAKYAFAPLHPYRAWTDLAAGLAAFAYFLVGSSRLTSGQTVGKKIVGIRVVSLDGADLDARQTILRALLIQVIIMAYFYLPHCLFFLGYVLPAQILFAVRGIRLPSTSFFVIVVTMILGYLSLAYTLANAVFCGLGPKKRSLHDLMAGTAVVRAGEESRGIEFAGAWDDLAEAKRKAATWPSVIIAGIVLILLVVTIVKAAPEIPKGLEPLKAAREDFDLPGFHVADMVGPSEETHRRYLEAVKKYEERMTSSAQTATDDGGAGTGARSAQRLEPLTTETLHFAMNGRKFVFVLECDEVLTSESLVADPRYADLARRLPALAAQLSSRFFKNEAGLAAPYTDIQIEFIESLPLYLYSSVRGVWRDVLPVAQGESSVDQVQTSHEQRRNDQRPPSP